jgi:hypothetical protein
VESPMVAPSCCTCWRPCRDDLGAFHRVRHGLAVMLVLTMASGFHTMSFRNSSVKQRRRRRRPVARQSRGLQVSATRVVNSWATVHLAVRRRCNATLQLRLFCYVPFAVPMR